MENKYRKYTSKKGNQKTKEKAKVSSIDLRERRIIYLDGEIDDKCAKETIETLLKLDVCNHKDITMYINSSGGSVSSGLAIYDVMNMIKSDVRTKNSLGKIKYYKSKKYLTKKEAQKAERDYLQETETSNDNEDMTFKELCNKHFEYQKDKVKITTLRNYIKRREHLKMFDDIKINKLSIQHFENWKKHINSLDMATRTKNDLYKYLKSILNYGAKWYDFNFTSMYNKMSSFDNPNEMPREMDFWTYEEFKQFIGVETDIRFKALFENWFVFGNYEPISKSVMRDRKNNIIVNLLELSK